jgi:Chemotaxis signal transduction protein
MSVAVSESNTHQLAGTWLLMRLSTELYALPGPAVRELIRYRAPVPVPGAPPSLPGLINQRGAILTVVNMHVLLGLEQTVPSRTSRYVYVHHEETDLALIADSVIDLIDIAADQVQALPTSLDPVRAQLLEAVVHHEDQIVALLDLDALLRVLREAL